MFKSLSRTLIALGIVAVATGIVALAWPGVTVLALVILFAVYAFLGAGLEAMRAFGSAKAGPVAGHLLLGLADLAAGVMALVWPGPTALVLVLIVASWAVVAGLLEIGAAFQAGEPAGTRALFALGGLVAAAFGAGAQRPCVPRCGQRPRREPARGDDNTAAGERRRRVLAPGSRRLRRGGLVAGSSAGGKSAVIFSPP